MTDHPERRVPDDEQFLAIERANEAGTLPDIDRRREEVKAEIEKILVEEVVPLEREFLPYKTPAASPPARSIAERLRDWLAEL